MRVLVVTDLYPPHAVGGYERSCADVVEAWRRAGHDVEVLTIGAGLVGHGGRFARSLLRAEPANRRAIAGALTRSPDVVSVWNTARASLSVLAAVAEAGVPTVFVVCDGWLADAPGDDPWMSTWSRHPVAARFVSGLTGWATTVPALDRLGSCAWVSAPVREATLDGAPSWAPRTGIVTGSGIDRRAFRYQRAQPWRDRIAYVGRLAPAKGIDDVVDAVALMAPSTTLDVIGPGTRRRRAELRRRAEDGGVADRIRWSVAERSELAVRYADADVVVAPPRWPEPFGLVALEAMACGRPVVATGTGGSAAYLRDGVNCLLVPPADPMSIAAAVARLRSDVALRARLVAGGLATAWRHDVVVLADRLAAWHEAHVGAVRQGTSAATGAVAAAS